MPAVVYPSRCKCDSRNLQHLPADAVLSNPAMKASDVFLPAFWATTKFPPSHCLDCGCSVTAHCYEEGLFRQSEGFAVGLEVLYEWGDKYSTGGVPFWTFWRDLVQKLKGLPASQLHVAMERYRKQFQAACWNFIELQEIDYAEGFRCPDGAPSVSNDAIMHGIKRRHCCLFCPWQPEDIAPLQVGSSFRDRVMIRTSSTRELLAAFASKTGRRSPWLPAHAQCMHT